MSTLKESIGGWLLQHHMVLILLAVAFLVFSGSTIWDALRFNLGAQRVAAGIFHRDSTQQARAEEQLSAMKQARAIRHLSALYQSRGEWDRSIDLLASVRGPDVSNDPISTYLAGLAYWRMGQRELAVEEWRGLRSARFFLQRGDAALAEGDTEAAEYLYQVAASVDPAVGVPYDRLAVISYRRADLNTAADLYSRALSRDPASPSLRYWLIRLRLERFGQEQALLSEIEQVLADLDSDNQSALDLLLLKGKVLARVGDASGAEAAWKLAAERFPRSAYPLEALGEYYLGARRYDSAQDVLRRAISLQPRRAGAYHLLGQTLAAMDRPDLAARYFQTAVELRGDSYWWYQDWAAALLKAGDACGAGDVYRQAMFRFSEDKGFSGLLEQLGTPNCTSR